MATGYSRGPEKEKGSSPPEAVRGRPTATPKVGGRRKKVKLSTKRKAIRLITDPHTRAKDAMYQG